MINFPNQSRVFDSKRRAVLFWGHDRAMEWSFFVTEDALRRLQPNVPRDEAGLLLAFDANRPLIYAAAMKALNAIAKHSTNSRRRISESQQVSGEEIRLTIRCLGPKR